MLRTCLRCPRLRNPRKPRQERSGRDRQPDNLTYEKGSIMWFALKFARCRLFIRAVGPMSDEQRRRLRAWRRAYLRQAAEWRDTHGADIPPPICPIFPSDVVGALCGARTRAGTPCRRTALLPAGRCRLHGGRSTGPRTTAGKARSAANGQCPKRKGKV